MEATIFFVLLTSGILLLCLEVFVPGGVLGGLGALSLIGAMAFSFLAFPAYAPLISLGIIVAVCVALALWIKLFPNSKIGQRMTLSKSCANYSAVQDGIEELLNKEGTASSNLHPSGFATIDGKRVDVVTEGGMIDSGASLKVVEVEGNRIVVRKID